ncbi:MAG: M3 family oligoendopeptidase [Treponema sp.]|jgi:pepF/M3 family oligoendopeptidase|nr:M3 family oligoendopeptidase [Treponema sp.]
MAAGFSASDAGTGPLPRWNLKSIYPSFDAPEYREDLRLLQERIEALLELLEPPLPGDPLAAEAVLLSLIRALDDTGDMAENLSAYAEAVYTTDTRNSRALGEINAVEAAALPRKKAEAIFRSRLAAGRELVEGLLDASEALRPFRFFLRESLAKAAFQLSPEMEDLANDLARSGGDAWGRLHEALSSTLSVLWDPAAGERKTVIALRDLAHNADRSIRERAYRAELEAWKSAEIPLAAALNGVKGTSITLDARRGWGRADSGGASARALRKSAFQSRMGEKTLQALVRAMESSLPLFRRYLKVKASLLGLETCAFYDLFAPLGAPKGGANGIVENGIAASGIGKTWTWEESAQYIPRRFEAFDPGMGTFARHAFAFSWIDAEGREGKVGGAYCTGFPLKGESRILCNFEGSFDSVSTVAHELGHAWHHELLKDLPRSRVRYPMTLAETASIFAETIVLEGALADEGSDPGRLGLIEGNLKDSCQVIVDILSRFYFEREVFDRRAGAELSPEDFCAIMLEAQQKTYGEGLDPALLHPFMWAVKSHYYSPGLAFYNYPYAFGLLFSLGLYARYEREGPAFASAYRSLLTLTGEASVEEAARSAGFDLEGDDFWQDGVAVIAKRTGEFERLARSAP